MTEPALTLRYRPRARPTTTAPSRVRGQWSGEHMVVDHDGKLRWQNCAVCSRRLHTPIRESLGVCRNCEERRTDDELHVALHKARVRDVSAYLRWCELEAVRRGVRALERFEVVPHGA